MNQLKFPFPPSWWQCCISLPDEADKVLVGKEGGVLFDYERGGRGRREFRTVIEPGMEGNARFISQGLADARTPIIGTEHDCDGMEFFFEVFEVVPPDAQYELPPRICREGGEEIIEGWDGPKVPRVMREFVKPGGKCGPEFLDVAWGDGGRTITYRVRVPTGGECTVVLGFAEGKWETGRRILKVEVEGGMSAILDPAEKFGLGAPGLCRLPARDTDGDGSVLVHISAAAHSPDQSAFVSAIWVFEEDCPSDEEILEGNRTPYAFADCGHPTLPRRQFLMRLAFKNMSSETRRCEPCLHLCSIEKIRLDGSAARIGCATEVRASSGIEEIRVQNGCTLAMLPVVELAPGGTSEIIVTINRHGYESGAEDEGSYQIKRQHAANYWASVPLPYGVIQVPDPRIQALLDSSVRNIYQARDIQHGLPAFHVGPTCYRQLWIVDGAFLLELVTMLGRADEARAGIAYMLGFQEEDGGFQLKARYWKETGIVIWAVIRQAVLTGDKAWLRAQWPSIMRAVDFIIRLRSSERAGDPEAPEFRLTPYGDIDGGISNMDERLPEYSNTYWLLIGLKAACEAARWLGEDDRAWTAEYENFFSVFLAAAERDQRTDSHGNRYLPIQMGGTAPPQKAQWAFCHAVHPGGLFEPGSPFVEGMLSMLEACKIEGLVFDTGWMPEGLWTYFASFLGHAQLWQGRPQAAYEALQSMANHAAPVLVWREEQKPAGQGSEEVGDMPHNWASAEFIRLTFHLIALERGDELHLFHGVPPAWIRPGAVIAIRGAATAFGPLTMSLRVSDTEIQIEAGPLARPCAGIVVHCNAWGSGQPLRFPADRAICHRIRTGSSADGRVR